MPMEISNAYNSYASTYTNGTTGKASATSAEKAGTSDYLAKLQKKNPKLNILTGYSNGAVGSSNYPESINVTIAPEFLAKMQSDPKLAAEYEKNLADIPAACKWGESMIHAMTGDTVYEFRFYIDENGNMSAGSVSGPGEKRAMWERSRQRAKQQKDDFNKRLEEGIKARAERREKTEKLMAEKRAERKEQEEKEALQSHEVTVVGNDVQSLTEKLVAANAPSNNSDNSNELAVGVIYDKGSETSSKIYTSNGTLQGMTTSTSKSKYSGQEILEEIDKYISSGQFYVIHYNGKETWLQGMTGGKNSEPVGGKKYFNPDELNAALGKGKEKGISVADNIISFDKYSYYKFMGKDGKEHSILSLGGALSAGILGNNSYDKEAADYVNFWNSLAKENPSGIYMKFSNEEIRSRLAEAGIENGFFTVSIGGRTVTHYLSQGENASAVHSKEQYDNRYNMITNGQFFKQFEAGHKVMIGGKEYILGEDKKLDIGYGADIFDLKA